MDSACFIIAEAGVNHNGSLTLAKQMAKVAKDSGADAVKYQTFRAESLSSKDAPKAAYQSSGGDKHQSQIQMLQGLQLSFEEFEELSGYCAEVDIEFMSTPFDEESAQFLHRLGMNRFKIPSGEITNPRLIRMIASLGRPMLLSTGMSTLEEVQRATDWIRSARSDSILWILHCVSAYPARLGDMNLRAMETLRKAFQVPVGLSDHTLGCTVPIAAAALGAVAIEKHFTLDRGMSGPDHAASLEPLELAEMIAKIREVESAMGDGCKRPVKAEADVARVARRSMVAARDLAVDTIITSEDIEFKRPGTGLEPWRMDELIGRTLVQEVAKDAILEFRMLK